MPTQTQDIVRILLQDGILTKEQYEYVVKKASEEKLSFEEALKQSKFVSDAEILRAQARAFGVEYIDLVGAEIPQDALSSIPENIARNYQMVVFKIDKEKKVLHVAMRNPIDIKAREALRYIGHEKDLKIKYYFVSDEGLNYVLQKFANISEEVGQALESAKERFETQGDAKEEAIAQKQTSVEEVLKHAPVAKMVSVIIRHAIEGKASDIHIEPLNDISRIRYRIDGVLATSISLPLYIHDALVARVKVMANLKIDETRIPQDGRIRMEFNDRDVEFRISTLPLQDHEKVVMRVLDTGGVAPQLSDLGYKSRNLEVINRNIIKPNGMILVTGPTGSGKSMTLFSILSILNSEDINICTLEDPVEYRMHGVNQSQIRPNVGFSFATGLRSLLRQDPDVIMVGEIRDVETAELAVHAALTGHIVLSTLHTNNAIGGVPRLVDMKVEAYLLSTTLNALIAQRLVRTICPDCKEEVDIDAGLKTEIITELKQLPAQVIKAYNVNLDKPVFYFGKGCARCGHTGFRGRTAITEVIENTKMVKDMINRDTTFADIDKVLIEQEYVTMKQDGLFKALLGITTPEQVLVITKEDI